MIDSFSREYEFLSNFHRSPFFYGDERWKTVEHAFQAYKTTDTEEYYAIHGAISPSIAKRMGREATLRPDWELIKLTLMQDLVRRKFGSSPKLTNRLIATEDEPLVEGNNWGDRFWGQVDGVGENHLGKILMTVRTELQIEHWR